MRVRKLLVVIVTAAALASSGCSFIFVNGPPSDHQLRPYFHCTESRAWPVVDGIWAALNGIGAMVALQDEGTPNRDSVVGVGIAWLVVSGAAAIWGWGKVNDCQEAKALYVQRYYQQHQQQPYPQPYQQPHGQPPAPQQAPPAPAPRQAPPAPAPAPAPAPEPAPVPPGAQSLSLSMH